MAYGITSPNTDNYTLSKGVVKWKPAKVITGVTAAVVSGNNAITLSSAADLVPGELYAITGTGIPASSVFYGPSSGVIVNLLTLALSSGIYMPGAAANATASGPTVAVAITPEFRHVGNTTDFEFTPNVDRLEHFSQMEGTKKRDKVVARQLTATMKVVMEEWTPANIALMMMGVASGGSPIIIDILTEGFIEGAFRFVGRNDIGIPVQMDFTNVSLTPSAAIGMLSDDWAKLEVSAEVLADASTGRFGRIKWGITGETLT
jgi:hypothetical protein